MPIFEYRCDKCKGIEEVVELSSRDAPECCGVSMRKLPTLPAIIRIKGQGYPSRKKWMENWTSDSPKFSTGSLHGERY